jgi:hypothetical protein
MTLQEQMRARVPPSVLADRFLREQRWRAPPRLRPSVEGVYRLAPAYQSIGTSAQGSSPRTTGSVSGTAGWLAFVVAGWEDAGTIGATGISGSLEGTSGWTVDTLIDGSGPRLQAGWKILSNSGSQTFTVTATGGSFMEAAVVLVSGIDQVTPYDKRTVNTGSSTTLTTGVSSDYAQADTWLVYAGKLYNNANYGTYLNSFTERFDGVGLCVAERTVSSTTGLNAGCTSTVNDGWAAGQWAFRGAATSVPLDEGEFQPGRSRRGPSIVSVWN